MFIILLFVIFYLLFYYCIDLLFYYFIILLFVIWKIIGYILELMTSAMEVMFLEVIFAPADLIWPMESKSVSRLPNKGELELSSISEMKVFKFPLFLMHLFIEIYF